MWSSTRAKKKVVSFHEGQGMLGRRIGDGRYVVVLSVEFDPIVDPGRPTNSNAGKTMHAKCNEWALVPPPAKAGTRAAGTHLVTPGRFCGKDDMISVSVAT